LAAAGDAATALNATLSAANARTIDDSYFIDASSESRELLIGNRGSSPRSLDAGAASKAAQTAAHATVGRQTAKQLGRSR